MTPDPMAVMQRHYDAAVQKAFDALGRYKFEMFGYWASKSVSIGHMMVEAGGTRPASPFKALVLTAREREASGVLDLPRTGCGGVV